jgi:hypothetical protein
VEVLRLTFRLTLQDSGFTQKPVPESRSADSILGPFRWLNIKMIGVALRIQNPKTSIPLQRLARLLPCHFRTVFIFYNNNPHFAQPPATQIFENLSVAPRSVQRFSTLVASAVLGCVLRNRKRAAVIRIPRSRIERFRYPYLLRSALARQAPI